jgi:tetratricopeptide (TPR) repeat protein
MPAVVRAQDSSPAADPDQLPPPPGGLPPGGLTVDHFQVRPGALDEFNLGVSALRQKEWALAIRHLEEARQADPFSPEILFNLGQAEAQVPGRELRAICWFEAYLWSTGFDVPYSQAVRKQVVDLQIRAEGNGRKLIELAKTLVNQMPKDSSDKVSLQLSIAQIEAVAGDFDSAKATIAAVENRVGYPCDYARTVVAGTLSDAGHFQDAIAMAEGVSKAEDAAPVYFGIADNQAQAGFIEDSRQTANRIANIGSRIFWVTLLADHSYSDIQSLGLEFGILSCQAWSNPRDAQVAKVHLDELERKRENAKVAGPAFLSDATTIADDAIRNGKYRGDADNRTPGLVNDSDLLHLAHAQERFGDIQGASGTLNKLDWQHLMGESPDSVNQDAIYTAVMLNLRLKQWDLAKDMASRLVEGVTSAEFKIAEVQDMIVNHRVPAQAPAELEAKLGGAGRLRPKFFYQGAVAWTKFVGGWLHFTVSSPYPAIGRCGECEIGRGLQDPIFTDFSSTVAGLPDAVPQQETGRSPKIARNCIQLALQWVSRSQEIARLRAYFRSEPTPHFYE